MIDVLLLDVFTDRAYTGNPLAVVFDAGGLGDRSMQAIANELNLSETVFLGEPDDDGAWPTRIFTPRVELPFAGHPSVGAAVALVVTGRLPTTDGAGRCVLDEAVGPVRVSVHRSGPESGSATLAVPSTPRRVRAVDRGSAADMIGLTPSDLGDVAPSVWSAGVDFAVVVVRDVDAVSRARPSADVDHVYVLAPVDGTPTTARTWRARMFAPAMGIAEDPATGAAAAATAGLLAELDETGGSSRSWTIEQGVEMGRPSRIEVAVERTAGSAPIAASIGGTALIVGSCRLHVPHDETISRE